jgi:hypothetical protein
MSSNNFAHDSVPSPAAFKRDTKRSSTPISTSTT